MKKHNLRDSKDQFTRELNKKRAKKIKEDWDSYLDEKQKDLTLSTGLNATEKWAIGIIIVLLLIAFLH